MKIKMTISGSKVHGVGYRPWLTDVAIGCGLCGFQASNRIEMGNPAVIVLAEGDEESVSYFEELVRSKVVSRICCNFVATLYPTIITPRS